MPAAAVRMSLAALVLFIGAPSSSYPPPASAELPTARVRVVRTYPHDARAFTQGLIYRDGYLYESTGRYGQSTLRQVQLETGTVLAEHRLPTGLFGEGLADWQGTLVQLTWQSGISLVYDLATLAPIREVRYPFEGWGLARVGHRLVASDGGAGGRLHLLDPDRLVPVGEVIVRAQGRPVERLNELEWVAGELLANVWQTDRVARIDLSTGEVRGWIDLAGLLTPRERQQADVLNGLAYDEVGGRLFVTGKYWPRLFEIEILPPGP